jgi:hypothetical protein
MESRRKSQLLPKEEPLFIRFLNSDLSREFLEELLTRLEQLFSEPKDKLTAKYMREGLKEHNFDGYKLIQTKFKDHVDYVIKFGTFEKGFGTWANFYLSSLKETKREDAAGNIERSVFIGSTEGDWVTGLILYNFSLFCKYYGVKILKQCVKCGGYFTVKGKYAVYCSEPCKKTARTEKSVDNPDL